MQAPNFELTDQSGKTHKLSDYEGQWVVVYFYPKDDTPKCTKEACGFRDNKNLLEENDIQVFGISADDQKSHEKFANKYDLNFPILSDTDGKVSQKYDVWKKKKMFGKEFMGIMRETFVINPEGEVAKHYEKVKDAENHAQEILEFIKSEDA